VIVTSFRLVAFCALAAGCRPAGGTADPVILSLGQDVVRRSEFDAHVKGLEEKGGSPLTHDVRRALLDPWLEERVQVLAARQKGLVSAGAAAEDERRAVERLLAEYARVSVSDAEVASYYQEHLEEFHVRPTVTLRQVLVATQNEARDVIRRLHREPRAFDSIARERSKGPEAEKGGLMGTFAPGELPTELEAAAFALPEGRLSEVVPSSFGFHVLRVDAKTPAREETLPEASARIRARLERTKVQKSARQLVADLMARAKVNHAAANPPSRPS
jgi:peptidyl-prolyl cis-trans isomerase C